VTVALALALKMLASNPFLMFVVFFEGLSPDGVELVRSEESGRRLEFRLSLDVEFDNGSVQSVPLEATVIVPSLRLASEQLDFGVCFVGQTRELPVVLSNSTDSDSYWHCKQGILFLLSCSFSVISFEP